MSLQSPVLGVPNVASARAQPSTVASPPERFAEHRWWDPGQGWKNILTNLRLILQPYVFYCLLLPWLLLCIHHRQILLANCPQLGSDGKCGSSNQPGKTRNRCPSRSGTFEPFDSAKDIDGCRREKCLKPELFAACTGYMCMASTPWGSSHLLMMGRKKRSWEQDLHAEGRAERFCSPNAVHHAQRVT